MKKVLSLCTLLAAVFAVFFAFQPYSEAAEGEEIVTETSAACLECHGPSYADLRELTKDYDYKGDNVQPHEYLDMAKGNPHDSLKVMECTLCHEVHAEDASAEDIKKPNLDYCINCHHADEMIACRNCHNN